jgi:hypothetical protein
MPNYGIGPDSDPYWHTRTLKRARDLHASLKRVTDCLAILIRESSDPVTEALAALDEARRLL